MAIRTLFGKKKRYGVQEKVRTKEEIDREYTHHALMYGHTSRLMMQHQKTLDHHLDALLRLAEEGSKLPQEKPKTEAAQENQTEQPTPA